MSRQFFHFTSRFRIWKHAVFLFVFTVATATSANAAVIINGAIWPTPITGTDIYTDIPSGIATTVVWSESGIPPSNFEQYNPTSNTRDTDNTYDHDGNVATGDVTIDNALEVNSDEASLTLRATFVLVSAFSAFPDLILNFGADSRGGVFGGTVELYNLTDLRYVIPNTPVVYDPGNDWQYNELTAGLLATDFGDTLELRFINPVPSSTAEGLELTAINLSVVPEPSHAILLLTVLTGVFLMRQRRYLHEVDFTASGNRRVR